MHLTNSFHPLTVFENLNQFLKPQKKCGIFKIPYLFALVLIATVLISCGTPGPDAPVTIPSENAYEIDGKIYHPIDSADGFRQQGVASWYGEQFHEKKTANGEIYNMYAMTAAHKTLPFGTMVEVKNVENDKSTVVRINDRGPFCRGRIIDLSFSAAEKIEMIRNGTAAVEIVALGTDDDVLTASANTGPDNLYFTGDFTIQVGAFGDPVNAERLKTSLEKIAENVHIVPIEKDGLTFYRVRVGRFTSLKQAQMMEQQLVQNGFENVYTVAWDL